MYICIARTRKVTKSNALLFIVTSPALSLTNSGLQLVIIIIFFLNPRIHTIIIIIIIIIKHIKNTP